MKKQIKLINDIIFNAIQHGADSGGSYYNNHKGLNESIKKYLKHNKIKGYILTEVKRTDKHGYIWTVTQIRKERSKNVRKSNNSSYSSNNI